jgi:hypothetical protein
MAEKGRHRVAILTVNMQKFVVARDTADHALRESAAKLALPTRLIPRIPTTIPAIHLRELGRLTKHLGIGNPIVGHPHPSPTHCLMIENRAARRHLQDYAVIHDTTARRGT